MNRGYFPRALWLTLWLSLSTASTGFAQRMYSYVDANGVRNFTNVPPRGNVYDLKVVGPPPPSSASNKAGSTRYDPIIDRYAAEYKVDPTLIRSMIATESGFQPLAVSKKGAKGLMQLMPSTAVNLGVRNVFDPNENIRGGVQHMKKLLGLFDNDLKLSLAAYNAGENLVQKVNRVPNIKETKDYVRLVTSRYGQSQLKPEPETSTLSRPVYRYFDRNGVLHLTNVPQFPKSENSRTTSWSGGAISPALQVP